MRKYKVSETFWKKFHALPNEQKELVREAWEKFKVDPFDPQLGTHKIMNLSARAREAVWSVVIDADLRVLCRFVDNEVHTLDMGTHKAYK